MSRLSNFIHEASEIAKRYPGSRDYRKRLRIIAGQFGRFLCDCDSLPDRIKQVPPEALEIYAQFCIARGLAVGSVGNQTTALRRIFSYTGKDYSDCTNAKIGVPNRDRVGKKSPLSENEISQLLCRALDIDEGLYFILQFQLLLGLRRKEALQCSYDLRIWLQFLESGENYVPVTRGTKGGRSRNVSILTNCNIETISAIRNAIKYTDTNGSRLINSHRGNLEGSINRLNRLYYRVGLSGVKSSHALRYNYACQNAVQRLDRGERPLDVLGEVAEDLGHGARTRKRFTLTTYLLSIEDRFSSIFKNNRLIQKPKQDVDSRATSDNQWKVPRMERSRANKSPLVMKKKHDENLKDIQMNIKDKLNEIVSNFGGSECLTAISNVAESCFAETLLESDVNADRLDDFHDIFFEKFIQRYESTQTPTNELLIGVALIRMTMIRLGRKPETLVALRAPRKRVRVKNTANGKSMFQLVHPSQIRAK